MNLTELRERDAHLAAINQYSKAQYAKERAQLWRQWMDITGDTQSELAKKIGVTRARISQLLKAHL